MQRALTLPRRLRNAFGRISANAVFFSNHKGLRNTRKIVYALTPPPRLSNIGDQAQVVAIYRWFAEHYPATPVIEIDKDGCISCIPALKRLVRNDDDIFIHSGGNLGDRGMWSETGRRNIIDAFPNNRIVSLPQTIHFSDTPEGRRQRKTSELVYNRHPNLTVIGRDAASEALARAMFPRCRTFSMPDFVLSLDVTAFVEARHPAPRGTLLCLRRDDESVVDPTSFEQLLAGLAGRETELFDTTIKQHIAAHERESILRDTLRYFDRFSTVVTDRFHGLIFATLLQKPTLVLPTVDHKLTSAIDWFKDLPYIRFATLDMIGSVPQTLRTLETCSTTSAVDWNSRYFARLKELLTVHEHAE